jgi:hypothetical protein
MFPDDFVKSIKTVILREEPRFIGEESGWINVLDYEDSSPHFTPIIKHDSI